MARDKAYRNSDDIFFALFATSFLDTRLRGNAKKNSEPRSDRETLTSLLLRPKPLSSHSRSNLLNVPRRLAVVRHGQ